MNELKEKLKTKFKNAKNIQQIINSLKQVLTLTQTNSIEPKDLEILLNASEDNNYHPNKEFKIKYKEDSQKYWNEHDRIKKYPSRILSNIDWQSKQINKKLFKLKNTVNELEQSILKTYEINKLRQQYGWYFQYLLEYGQASMKRNGFNIKKQKFETMPKGFFAPEIIEISETITFNPPKKSNNGKTIISKL